jgi:hypothetical protein
MRRTECTSWLEVCQDPVQPVSSTTRTNTRGSKRLRNIFTHSIPVKTLPTVWFYATQPSL